MARHWIGGEWVEEGVRRHSINPANGSVIGSYCDGGTRVAQAAIEAAARAFRDDAWRCDALARSAALSRLADVYEAHIEDLVNILCLENGKVRGEAQMEAGIILRSLRFNAGLATQNFGRVLETQPGVQGMSIRQPLGVAGLIVPWNSPAYLCVRALAPALAAGCTAVVKMPSQSAQAASLTAEIIAGVPALAKGVVNLFIESGSEGARLLVDSPLVPVVNFTGSTHTGRLIAQAAAVHLKRVGLELGGKTPHLVFDDADLDAVLPTLEKSSTVFAGQFCMTGSRILVQRGIAARLKEGLAERLRKVVPGPASDPRSNMGPMIDKAAVARVSSLVEAAIQSGARVIVRGGPSTLPELADGAFYHPTLLEVSDSSLPIVRKETFGPVQTLQVFDGEEEAIELANDSEYGLSACIWSRDVDRPIRVARRLDAGQISINGWANVAVEFEEGGFKASGSGRLCGNAALDDFLEYKQITQTFGGPR
jgi:betaine-aldehyde dehydrogenase